MVGLCLATRASADPRILPLLWRRLLLGFGSVPSFPVAHHSPTRWVHEPTSALLVAVERVACSTPSCVEVFGVQAPECAIGAARPARHGPPPSVTSSWGPGRLHRHRQRNRHRGAWRSLCARPRWTPFREHAA